MIPLRAARISCPASRPAPRNYAATFERWCGFRISAEARRVISVLERQRLARLPQRLIVCRRHDSPDTTRRALVDYARYLVTRLSHEELPLFLTAPKRDDARALLPYRPKFSRREDYSGSYLSPVPRPQLLLGSGRSPLYPRGLWFNHAVILDGDRFPRRGKHLSRQLQAILPAVAIAPDSMIVIHGEEHPRTRVNHFSHLCRLRLWPVVDLNVNPPPLQQGLPDKPPQLGDPPPDAAEPEAEEVTELLIISLGPAPEICFEQSPSVYYPPRRIFFF